MSQEQVKILGPNGTPLKKKSTQIKANQDRYIERFEVPNPRHIFNNLDERVFGNRKTKKSLAVALKKAEHRINNQDLNIQKSNMLIFGDTGCGKTLLVETLAKSSKLPFVNFKMSGLSREGYQGKSLNNLYEQLVEHVILTDPVSQEKFEAENIIKNGHYAIIYLDEIDKIAKPGNGNFSEGIQDELIGQIEEALVLDDYLSTKDMLFIGTGAFSGLEKIIESRLNSTNSSSIGFGSKLKSENKINKSQLLEKVTHEDLIEYGFKPELAGRFPILSTVEQLNTDSLISIMQMESSYLSTQKKLLEEEYDISIEIPQKTMQLIAKRAQKIGTNARALQGLTDKLLEDIYFSPSEYGDKVVFTPEYATELLDN